MVTAVCWMAYLIARQSDKNLRKADGVGCLFLGTLFLDVLIIDLIHRLF